MRGFVLFGKVYAAMPALLSFAAGKASTLNLYYRWSKEFPEAGKKRLAGGTARQAGTGAIETLCPDPGGPGYWTTRTIYLGVQCLTGVRKSRSNQRQATSHLR